MKARCEHCGGEFVVAATGRTPRYCSTRHRVAAHRAQARIPTELTARDRWVRRDGKRPVTPAGAPASSADPATWSTYAAARKSATGDGLGFVLGDGIACLDLDHCLVDGAPAPWAAEVLARVPGAYVEVSPSGDGLHVWGRAPEQRGRRRDGIEAYSTGRYITVTGNVFADGGLVDLSEFFEGGAVARKASLHAVGADEAPPARPKTARPKTVTQAASDGTTRELLVAMRARIAKAVEDTNTPARDLAALTKRLVDIARDIEAIDAREEQEAVGGGPVSDETFDATAI